MAVRDGERYVEEAVRSVLDQSFDSLELIAVDDGSTDRTAEILRESGPTVRVLHQPPAGLAAAVNDGMRAARGAFFAFVDADDLWTPRKLELQMGVLAADPEVDLAFGHVRQFVSPELTERQRTELVCPPHPAPGYLKGAMLIRREAFASVGPFDTTFRLGDFVDWFSRAKDQGLKGVMLPDVVLLRRLHEGNTTRRTTESQIDYARIARAALSRRRAGGERDY
jgi:glycosyltransferase involved in cell wall biosynthesis